MSQTKQECMEYMLVLLDDMKSEVRKIMHKDNYQTYDGQTPDFDYLYEALGKMDEELESLQDMFDNSIPEDVKRRMFLEEENEALKNNILALRDKIDALQKKLDFSLTLKE